MSASTRELLDACVHCGFCLPACPTYTLWGEEMDSPRGRIQLMSMVEDGEVAMDESVARHLDRCLGCLACVPACPSGVRYDRLIERARVRRRAEAPRGCAARAGWSAALYGGGAAAAAAAGAVVAAGGRHPARARWRRGCRRPTCAPRRRR